MNELIKVDFDRQTVSARNLWEALDKPWGEFLKWFNQFKDYGFIENADYRVIEQLLENPKGGRPATDYEISVDMAKELAMLSKTEKGKQIRQYLIALEKAWNNPEAVMARALKIANRTIEMLQPKADYFDALVERNLLTNFRDTAKELHIKERKFIDWLQGNGYIYRDKKDKIKPYAEHVPDLFELKEFMRNGFTDTRVLITPRGRETFRLLLKKESTA